MLKYMELYLSYYKDEIQQMISEYLHQFLNAECRISERDFGIISDVGYNYIVLSYPQHANSKLFKKKLYFDAMKVCDYDPNINIHLSYINNIEFKDPKFTDLYEQLMYDINYYTKVPHNFELCCYMLRHPFADISKVMITKKYVKTGVIDTKENIHESYNIVAGFNHLLRTDYGINSIKVIDCFEEDGNNLLLQINTTTELVLNNLINILTKVCRKEQKYNYGLMFGKPDCYIHIA